MAVGAVSDVDWFYGISVVLELIITLICINYLYNKKIQLTIHDVLFMVINTIIAEGAYFLDLGGQSVIPGYAVIIFYQMAKFKTNINKVRVNTILYVSISVAVQLIYILPVLNLGDFISVNILVMFVNILLVLIMLVLGRKGWLNKLSVYILRHEWLEKVSILCCFLGTAYLCIVHRLTEYLRVTDIAFFGVITILLCVMVMNWQRAKEDSAVKEKELELRKAYDTMYGQLLESVRRKQHDFDSHIQAILAQHMVADTLEELVERQRRYCDDVRHENQYNKLLSGGNSIVIGFLYSKFVEAEAAGCEISYKVKTEQLECQIPSYKLIEILGVLLDNAMEAVEDRQEKKLYIELIENTEQIHILVGNSFERVTREQMEEFIKFNFSTKGSGRGIGLSNVVDILQQYNCDLMIYNKEYIDGNRIIFEIDIKKDM